MGTRVGKTVRFKEQTIPKQSIGGALEPRVFGDLWKPLVLGTHWMSLSYPHQLPPTISSESQSILSTTSQDKHHFALAPFPFICPKPQRQIDKHQTLLNSIKDRLQVRKKRKKKGRKKSGREQKKKDCKHFRITLYIMGKCQHLF